MQRVYGSYREIGVLPADTAGYALEIRPGIARVQTTAGTIILPGLVVNHMDRWVRVLLEVHLYDPAGRDLLAGHPLSDFGRHAAPFAALPPGGSNGFQHTMEGSWVEGLVVGYRLTVVKVAVAPIQPPLDVADVHLERDDIGLTVTGTVTNRGAGECRSPLVTAIGYAADGRVYAVDPADVEDDGGEMVDTLPPGQSGRFEATLLDDTNAVVRVEVVPGSGLFS